ncbi:hypothetical protein N7508_003683 [Penicillium antarcticum]|uniref:uncharacterized protein n=1 Tax=Penicillium antarcticum TaxID=416450 RepID=UPI00238D316E|nr:uncharacterized protein N7508_003683 [Penicillium antarcticum]KAJ5312853.1 hypothetical protein N7508_003683 [Penicillium antarcticum]
MHQFQKNYVWKRVSTGIKLENPSLSNNRHLFSPHAYSANKPTRKYSTIPNIPCEIPATQLESKTHPLGWEKIQAQVEPYFGNNWNFASEKEKRGFLAIGFSRAFSHFFPLTLDCRIETSCKVFYLTLLIDDQLEKMSFEQMHSYRERVMRIALGAMSPDKHVCLEWMLHDTFQSMRNIDEGLAGDAAQGFCQLLQAQTSQERSSIQTLGSYLKFREIDAGKPFGANLRLNPAELERLSALESASFRHMGVINDIYSWEREWKMHQENPTDGSRPLSAIYILANETGLPFTACKRLMYSYCRELELIIKHTGDELQADSVSKWTPEMDMYFKGLESFMRGNELWSQWTPRYRQ